MSAKTIQKEKCNPVHHQDRHAGIGAAHPPRWCLAYGKMFVGCSKIGHFQKVCRSKKTREVNEVEQETKQDIADEDIKLVSIN